MVSGGDRAGTELSHHHAHRAAARPSRRGLTSVANPQTALSTASLFAATMPAEPPLLLGFGAIAVMAMVAITWYSLVACALTLRPAAAVFARARRWTDRIAGLAFMGFGAKLALER